MSSQQQQQQQRHEDSHWRAQHDHNHHKNHIHFAGPRSLSRSRKQLAAGGSMIHLMCIIGYLLGCHLTLLQLASCSSGYGGHPLAAASGQYGPAPSHQIYPAPQIADAGPQHQHCVLTVSQLPPVAANNSSAAAASYSYAPIASSLASLASQTLGTYSSYLSDYYSSASRAQEEQYQATGDQHMEQQQLTACITQHDIDQAIEEARACFSNGGQLPAEIYAANSEQPQPMQVASVAEIIAQATRILANRFSISETSILYDLPSVDMSKSRALEKICPVFLRPDVNCDLTLGPDGNEGAARYRTLTGYCNNLQYPSWGSTRSAMVRFLAPDYYDSISLPRRAYDGSPLPSARVVSFVVHQDPPELDQFHSMLSVVWGQFIDHDMTLAVQATDEMSASSSPQQQVQPNSIDASGSNNKLDCCSLEVTHPDCFPIEIPKGDPFYGYFDKRCMHFTRATPGVQPGCSLGPSQAMNKLSSYMDGNLIYGSTVKQMRHLRTFRGGQLRSQPVDSRKAFGIPSQAPDGPAYLQAEYLSNSAAAAAAGAYGPPLGPEQPSVHQFKALLPSNVDQPDNGCERRARNKGVYCFEAGDSRANEQIQLTTMHTLFMREHNRVASELAAINPHWNDERLFQVARQVVVAQLQHVTFNEFLPLVIGKEKLYEYELVLEAPGRYYQGYDSKINAGIRVEFQAAAFRYGHSILPSYIERYNKYHQKIESIRLSKLLKQPYDLYHPGVLDSYLLGLVNQRSGRMDPTLTTEVTNHLFERPGNFFGVDLAAINIQRGRDLGVPGYNHFRHYCGLPRAKHFDDLMGAFSNKTLLRLSQLYKHVDDIDLWTAGIAEYPVGDGGLVGPTFACLIARQFVNLRRGDRFWYENGPMTSVGGSTSGSAAGYRAHQLAAQFTIEQLDELRKSTSARLICDNSDDIDTIQAQPMLVHDRYSNPLVSCASLARVDLTKWREEAEEQADLVHSNKIAEGAYGTAPTSSRQLVEATASAIVGGAHPVAAELAAHDFEPIKATSHQFVDHLVSLSNYKPELGAGYNSLALSPKATA